MTNCHRMIFFEELLDGRLVIFIFNFRTFLWILFFDGGRYFYPPCWFFLSKFDNSKKKAVTLEFCIIQEHFIRDNCPKFGIPNLTQFSDIGQISAVVISNFWISRQWRKLKYGYFRNSRTCNDIDMNLGTVNKLDKGNMAT